MLFIIGTTIFCWCYYFPNLFICFVFYVFIANSFFNTILSTLFKTLQSTYNAPLGVCYHYLLTFYSPFFHSSIGRTAIFSPFPTDLCPAIIYENFTTHISGLSHTLSSWSFITLNFFISTTSSVLIDFGTNL